MIFITANSRLVTKYVAFALPDYSSRSFILATCSHCHTTAPNWESQPNCLNISCGKERLGGLSVPLHSNNDTDISISSYASLLQSCTNVKALKQVHALLLLTGLNQNVFLGTKLVNMYAKWGNLADARLVFDKTYEKNDFLWNAMIRGYAWNGPWEETLTLYYQMQWHGIQPNNFTFSSALKACAGLSALQEGRKIHYHIVRTGFESHVFVGTALMDMYVKCQSLQDARQVFEKMATRDVVSWNAMIVGYAQIGHSEEALTLFHRMQLTDVLPDSITMASLLSACTQLGALQQGKAIHDYIIRNRFDLDVFVGNSLVDMYAKCGKIEIARQLFDKMSQRDVVSWNAMIAGYAQNGHANEALAFFQQMQLAGMAPGSVAMVSALSACAHLGALQQGKSIHDYIIKNGFEWDVFVGNSLIDMYAKCGRIQIARQVFDKMSVRDVISWNAMIAGYGTHGHGENAIELFHQMQRKDMKPNHITFVCILHACSHAGLVDEGWQCFHHMIQDYCVTPTIEHYACMVDLLGRAGRLDEAEDFIKKMPLKPDDRVWGTLLGACRIHCNIELGERVAGHLFELETKNAGYYVLLSNIYAEAGRWDDVTKVRTMMKEMGLRKTPGYSLIEVNNRVHAFLVGDTSHPQCEKIYAMLDTLYEQMEKAGYAPNTNFVLHNVEEDVKEHMLCSHSEKLAIAFGLINTSPGTPIQITKNLRVCGDCHTASKFISKIVRREIVVRDAIRFHHFKDGLCSCRDYW